MDHTEIKEKLFDYYDGQLPPEEGLLFSQHLQGCNDCQDLIENWSQTARAYLQPLQVAQTEVFTQKVMRKVRAFVQRDEGQRWRLFSRWAYPVLALSISGFVAVLAYTLQPATVPTNGLLLEDQDSAISTEWIPSASNEDPLTASMQITQ
jgi:anti-sigma factor RsiW